MKDKIIPILMVLGISMFCGIIVIGIGLGSVFIPLNGIGASIVCGDRDLNIVQNSYNYIPGQETTTITAYCVDAQTGENQEVTAQLYDVTFKLQMVNGVIFGILFFVFGMFFLRWAARRLNKPFEDLFKPSVSRNR